MDEMKLKLRTSLMRGLLAKLLSKLIFDKTGHKINIGINDIELQTVEGDIKLHINADATISNEEFSKILKSIDL